MTEYQVPLKDMLFVLTELTDLVAVSSLPGYDDVTPTLLDSILAEAGKFASGVLAPLNRKGDLEGAQIADGVVTTPAGWPDAYRQFREAGWVGLGLPTQWGGQGLPKLVAAPVNEIWAAANLSFSMAPLLSLGASNALLHTASDEIKSRYLAKMVSGEWASAMSLTEPQAGSDLGAITTRAMPQADGTYRLFGQKIFISFGDHDLAQNIVHLVLARLPDAPSGVKGISLFVVSKFLVGPDGSLGARNDVRCISIEEKMGLHASPTCAISYGQQDGAIGHLVGEANCGLEYMFVMMHEERIGAGLEGIGIADRAYQQALAYARERVQGRDAVSGENHVAIIRHPDVKRMLLSMRAKVMAARMLTYSAAGWFDLAERHPDHDVAQHNRALLDLLMPVVKGWSTELANQVVYDAVQVHGGMGYVEETGIAQHMRDARVTTLYEGTTGIQGNDLLGRKILREQGATLKALTADIRDFADGLRDSPALVLIGARLGRLLETLELTLEWILAAGPDRRGEVLAGAVPFLHLLGTVCGGWQMARAAVAAERVLARPGADSAYLQGIVDLCKFYLTNMGPQANACAQTIMEGGACTVAYAESAL